MAARRRPTRARRCRVARGPDPVSGFLRGRLFGALLLFGLLAAPPGAGAASLGETIKAIKPSIVGVGTFLVTRRPPARLLGTGFVVADGRHVLTNAHVIAAVGALAPHEKLVVFIGSGERVERRVVAPVSEDRAHDVALLRLTGAPLPALALGRDDAVEEGREIAFTGFPIGAVLGLFPVTHRGIVSALTPVAVPAIVPGQLDAAMIRRLREPFSVFQLDATAYPGNSGSPLYDPESGRVLAIVSSVFVKRTKENLLKDPSGITYAIPIRFARRLIEDAGLAP